LDGSGGESDSSKVETKAGRHSINPYGTKVPVPTQQQFYPSQWRDVLDKAKELWRRWMSITEGGGFPNPKNKEHVSAALGCLMSAIETHESEGGVLEEGK
jgi:hypothetical protein